MSETMNNSKELWAKLQKGEITQEEYFTQTSQLFDSKQKKGSGFPDEYEFRVEHDPSDDKYTFKKSRAVKRCSKISYADFFSDNGYKPKTFFIIITFIFSAVCLFFSAETTLFYWVFWGIFADFLNIVSALALLGIGICTIRIKRWFLTALSIICAIATIATFGGNAVGTAHTFVYDIHTIVFLVAVRGLCVLSAIFVIADFAKAERAYKRYINPNVKEITSSYKATTICNNAFFKVINCVDDGTIQTDHWIADLKNFLLKNFDTSIIRYQPITQSQLEAACYEVVYLECVKRLESEPDNKRTEKVKAEALKHIEYLEKVGA